MTIPCASRYFGDVRKRRDPQPQKVGGLVFYFSLAALVLLLRPIYGALIPSWHSESLSHLFLFVVGVCFGAGCAHFLIRGKVSIFIHELKHSILSNLVGNRAKRLEVQKRGGSFEYEYSDQTAAYNAFISLAPYCLPIFAVSLLMVALPFLYNHHFALVLVMGLGWGADLLLNLRDVAPHQTDLSFIRGGIPVALAYILIFNLVLLGFALLWCVGGLAGYKNFLLIFAELIAFLQRIPA